MPARTRRIQELLIICHSGDPDGLATMNNICTGLEFSKIPFAVLDIKRNTAWPTLDAYDSILICTELIFQLEPKKAERLRSYVHAGGGLFVGYRCWSEHLSDLFGFADSIREPDMHDTAGLSFCTEIFPDATGLRITEADWDLDNNHFDVEASELLSSCKIIVTDLEERPIAWRLTFGKGRIVYWNTSVLFCRALRGLILHTIMDTMPVAASAITGFAMLHVDDFPPSLSDTVAEPVASEFPGLDWNGFFFDVWHKDMMALKAKHGLKFTWYVVMNYGDVDNNPNADLNSLAIKSGEEILARRFEYVSEFEDDDELGFHGYNHDPLVAESWPDLAILRSKLKLARELWQNAVPAPMPTSWVPANNWYHADHIRILKEVFPEISVVSCLFSVGDFENGEFREFGPEPWEDSLLCVPRETYGYSQSPEGKMMMLSQIAGMGVWNHFLHADDIYDIPVSSGKTTYHRNHEMRLWRAPNGDGKPGLYQQLDKWITQVRDLFPWLEFVTTSQAAERYRAHVQNNSSVFISDKCVEIHSEIESLFYIKIKAGLSIHPDKGGELIDCRPVDEGILNVVRCSVGTTLFQIKRS